LPASSLIQNAVAIAHLPPSDNVTLKDFAISIIHTLRQHGFQAYLAGGCVRDLLLEREPADYDVATSATPQQVM
jgi:poly(A) polymerase